MRVHLWGLAFGLRRLTLRLPVSILSLKLRKVVFHLLLIKNSLLLLRTWLNKREVLSLIANILLTIIPIEGLRLIGSLRVRIRIVSPHRIHIGIVLTHTSLSHVTSVILVGILILIRISLDMTLIIQRRRILVKIKVGANWTLE